METLQEKKKNLEVVCGSVYVPWTDISTEEEELWFEFLELLKIQTPPAMEEQRRAILQKPHDKIRRKKISNIRRYNLLKMKTEEQQVGLQSVSNLQTLLKTEPCNANTCHKRKLTLVIDDGGEKTDKQKKKINNIKPNVEELQNSFRTFIEHLGGINTVLVVQKKLHKSDIDPVQRRFLMPRMKINGDFLTAEESRVLQIYQKNKYAGEDDMRVPIIEPSMESSTVSLRVWGDVNKQTHVLVKGWNSIVERNKLQAGQTVQLWGFRIGPQLCFALQIVDELPLTDPDCNL